MGRFPALGTSELTSPRSSASGRPGLEGCPDVWVSCVWGVSGCYLSRSRRLSQFRTRYHHHLCLLYCHHGCYHGLLDLHGRRHVRLGLLGLEMTLLPLDPRTQGMTGEKLRSRAHLPTRNKTAVIQWRLLLGLLSTLFRLGNFYLQAAEWCPGWLH